MFIKVNDIIQNFWSPYGTWDKKTPYETWQETFELFRNMPEEHSNIKKLQKEHETGYRNPIVLDYESGFVSNGCHRITAAYTTDPNSLIATTNNHKQGSENFIYLTIEDVPSQNVDELYETLRSFPFHNGWCELEWITSENNIVQAEIHYEDFNETTNNNNNNWIEPLSNLLIKKTISLKLPKPNIDCGVH